MSASDYQTNPLSGHRRTSRPAQTSVTNITSEPVGQGHLWTPTENLVDSFAQMNDDKDHKEANTLAPIGPQTQTPPESPALPSLTSATQTITRDEPLYPISSEPIRLPERPLFENHESPQTHSQQEGEPEEATAQHWTTIALSSSTPKRSRTYPDILGIHTPAQARAFYEHCLEEQRRCRAYRLPTPLLSAAASTRDEVSTRQLSSLTRPAGVVRSRPTPRAVPRLVTNRAASSQQASPPPRRRARVRISEDLSNDGNLSASKHKRAAANKQIEDEIWYEIPDYCPPTSTLDAGKTLRAEWKAGPRDNSHDEERGHLHEQEINVASILRLPCRQYLTTKRQIFRARLQAYKENKPSFTKTAAQAACKMDVNKSSQLWEAFERVGWFDKKHFEQWL